MTTLDVFVPGSPRTKGSWRPIRRKDGGVFMKASTDEKPWAMAVAWTAREAKPVLVDKPQSVLVYLTFVIRAPIKSKNSFPNGDTDKLSRSVLDALTGIAWSDDVQVVELHAVKRWGAEPGVRIRVEVA